MAGAGALENLVQRAVVKLDAPSPSSASEGVHPAAFTAGYPVAMRPGEVANRQERRLYQGTGAAAW